MYNIQEGIHVVKPYNAADALAAICDASFDWGFEPPVWGKGWSVGGEDGSLSSPVVTSCRLPPHCNHRPISHHFLSDPTCHGRTDR